MMKRPNLFIVGEPKCGTSAMYRFLQMHPDVFAIEEKEPNYFDTDFQKKSDRLNGAGKCFPIRKEKDYLALFSGAKD